MKDFLIYKKLMPLQGKKENYEDIKLVIRSRRLTKMIEQTGQQKNNYLQNTTRKSNGRVTRQEPQWKPRLNSCDPEESK